jgi:hypothetical protein
MSVAHLYKITNNTTGEYYVGKHNGVDQKKSNGQTYWGSGKRIKRQLKKYGTENFTYKILVIGNTDYIFELEKKMVTEELIKEDKFCLNLKKGGEGVRTHRQDTIERLKNRVVSEETRQKMAEAHFGHTPWNKGKKMSSEYCDIAKSAAKEYWKDKPGFMTGKVHTEETKDKLRLAWDKRRKEKKGLTSGYTFINNKVQTKLVSPDDLKMFLESGWTKGMLRK